ncbi:MAG: hypothetical protein WCK51_07145 [Armatimonadota bacterium]
MSTRRGSTLIEMTLALVLTALIVGTASTLYSFVAIRTADAVSRFSTLQSSTTLVSAMRVACMGAVRVETKSISGKTALVCTLPKEGIDRDADGFQDYTQPDATDKMLRETYSRNQRVWFYSADALGLPGSTGSFWFMAIRTDDTTPTVSDINRDWSFWQAGQPRVSIPGTVTFTVVTSSQLVRVRLQTATSEPEDGGLATSRRPARLDLNHRFHWRGAM